MSVRTQQILTADEMLLAVFCGGETYVGVRLAGTWAGTITFEESYDGVNFVAATVTPFATGTNVQTATANGNWFKRVGNALVFRARISTYTSGSPQVYLATSKDASYQDAFLTPATIYVSNESTATNTLTQAAQANRAWCLKTMTVAASGLSWAGGSARYQIFDGAITGTVLWAGFLQESTVAGSVGREYAISLPEGGVTGTPGNAMTIRVLGPGASVTTIINAEFSAK